MNEPGFYSAAVTAIFGFCAALAWPATVLIIVCIFRRNISQLLANIENIRFPGGEVNLVPGDTVEAPTIASPVPQRKDVVIKVPTATAEAKAFAPSIQTTDKLSDEEIKLSKERAQRRLDEDTKKVGFRRGEISQNSDGLWIVHWGGKYPL